ncbi:MAG: hypothetical protein LC781_20695 [Actinobacteria bacterium]|nr:hypothetical protein [Actinomycetota bacterium]
MSTFLALYRGATVGDARLVAVTAEPSLVTEFVEKLLGTMPEEEDAVLRSVENGRRRALRAVVSEIHDAE